MHSLSRPDTLILMAYERHNEVADEFWRRVLDFFEVTVLPAAELDPVYRHPKIEILRLQRKERDHMASVST